MAVRRISNREARPRRLAVLPALLTAAALALSACGGSDSNGGQAAGSTAEEETKTIAFSFPFRAVDIYKPLIDAAKAEAEEQGYELLESSAGISAAEQLSEVNTWIAQGVDAIVLFSLEPDSMAPVVDKAHEAGVEVIGYGENIPGQDGSIVFNNEQGAELIGQVTGDYINEQMGGQANIGVLSFLTGKQNRIRTENAVETILEVAPGAEVVAEAQANDAGAALEASRPMLAANPNIDVLVANTDDAVNGFQAALGNRPSTSFWFASYDASTPILKKMLAGDLKGVTGYLPTEEIGQTVVTAAANAISGDGPTSISPEYEAVTSDDREFIQEILAERGAD